MISFIPHNYVRIASRQNYQIPLWAKYYEYRKKILLLYFLLVSLTFGFYFIFPYITNIIGIVGIVLPLLVLIFCACCCRNILMIISKRNMGIISLNYKQNIFLAIVITLLYVYLSSIEFHRAYSIISTAILWLSYTICCFGNFMTHHNYE